MLCVEIWRNSWNSMSNWYQANSNTTNSSTTTALSPHGDIIQPDVLRNSAFYRLTIVAISKSGKQIIQMDKVQNKHNSNKVNEPNMAFGVEL